MKKLVFAFTMICMLAGLTACGKSPANEKVAQGENQPQKEEMKSQDLPVPEVPKQEDTKDTEKPSAEEDSSSEDSLYRGTVDTTSLFLVDELTNDNETVKMYVNLPAIMETKEILPVEGTGTMEGDASHGYEMYPKGNSDVEISMYRDGIGMPDDSKNIPIFRNYYGQQGSIDKNWTDMGDGILQKRATYLIGAEQYEIYVKAPKQWGEENKIFVDMLIS